MNEVILVFPVIVSDRSRVLSAVSKMLFELGDPIGPEMTLPPFALARFAGVVGCLGDGELPLIAELSVEGTLA